MLFLFPFSTFEGMQWLKSYQFVPKSPIEYTTVGKEIKRMCQETPRLVEIIEDYQSIQFFQDFGIYINQQLEWVTFKRDSETDVLELIDTNLVPRVKPSWSPVLNSKDVYWIFIGEKCEVVETVSSSVGNPIMPLAEIFQRFISRSNALSEIEAKFNDLGLADASGDKSFSYKGMLVGFTYNVHDVAFNGIKGKLLTFQMADVSRPFEKFSADFYKVVLNSAAVDIAVFDTDHRYMLINEFAIKNREIRNWLIGRTDYDYCNFRKVDDTMARFREKAFIESRDGKKMVEIEETMTDAEGNKHHSVKRFKPIVIDGEVRYMMGFGMDVTPLKMAQERFQESEERYRELFESSVDIIQSVDNHGKFIFANRAWHRLFEYDQTELESLNLFDLIVPESLPHCLDMFASVLDGHSHADVHAVFRSKGGKQLVLEGNVVPRIVSGKVVATHAFFRDVTDREHKDEQLRASLLEKEALLGEIHHRVKNNLAVVYSLMELQAMQEKNAEIAFAYRESQSRIKAMALVHEMLYQDHTFGSVDLFAYLKSLSEHLRSLLAVDKKVELSFNGHESRIAMTHAVTCGLFANEVLTNAYKYAVPKAENPKIQIRVETEGEQVVLQIQDNGPGLSQAFDDARSNSLGFKLIKTFAAQLKGELSVQADNGLLYQLKFKSQ